MDNCGGDTDFLKKFLAALIKKWTVRHIKMGKTAIGELTPTWEDKEQARGRSETECLAILITVRSGYLDDVKTREEQHSCR